MKRKTRALFSHRSSLFCGRDVITRGKESLVLRVLRGVSVNKGIYQIIADVSVSSDCIQRSFRRKVHSTKSIIAHTVTILSSRDRTDINSFYVP